MTVRRLARTQFAVRYAVPRAGGLHWHNGLRPCLSSRAPHLPGINPRDGVKSIHSNAFILPPLMFTGLLGVMWIWKCFMMIVFQNKIIYMPGLPPNARSEKIQTYEKECTGVRWRKELTRAEDGTSIALAVGDVIRPDVETETDPSSHTYILYFQGNASSLPPRLPYLSKALRPVAKVDDVRRGKTRCTMVCLSYRGYWTSKGRPSETGINQDAAAALKWTAELHEHTYTGRQASASPFVLFWGQSIGSGIATNLAAASVSTTPLPLTGLVLETPFLSVREMLAILYPWKWVPYKYLWPFLRNHLDSWRNLGTIAEGCKARNAALPEVLILESGRDELVPGEQGERIHRRCLELQLPVEKKTVAGAFHNEAIVRVEGREAVTNFIIKQITAAGQSTNNRGRRD